MKIEFVGGPHDGERWEVDVLPPTGWLVPIPPTPILHAADPDPREPFATVRYERERGWQLDSSGVESICIYRFSGGEEEEA